MKKITLLFLTLAVAAFSAGAQISTNAQLNALAASITISVTDSGSAKTYAVTVPNAAAAVLTGAQRAGESDTDYVRRAFVAGAAGLIQQRQQLAAQSAAIAAALAANQAKSAALSNSLAAMNAKLN